MINNICKVWRGDSDVTWRNEQQQQQQQQHQSNYKLISPLTTCATTTTTTTATTITTGGIVEATLNSHLSPPIAAPVTTPDHRTAATLQARQGISPGK
ncbi:hypothetical protein PV325_006445 [Microctonus aethiopoides]|nr:hypothetical protein PV325_006445 [Microctonus aethiopoides]